MYYVESSELSTDGEDIPTVKGMLLFRDKENAKKGIYRKRKAFGRINEVV